jgi:Trk K+ transport system NAD-binding subunit
MPNLIYIILRRLRSPLIFLILVYAISMTGFVLIPGLDDKNQIHHMSFFDAFYFVSFMGTTIGFGEIPYAFVPAQRYWTLLSLYATVIAWLYAIGSVLGAFQDPAFRLQLKRNAFTRKVISIREPFYLVCGYGDTGAQLVRALAKEGILSVIIDNDQNRINELEITDFIVQPLWICADASHSEILESAGIKHPWCTGIISLANNDNVNLTVAIVAHLLNPQIRLISRADTPEAKANILSFGANEVINPFDIFASHLTLALRSPGLSVLFEWMTAEPGERIKEPVFPSHGMWIICGFGKFGEALYRYLNEAGEDLRIIDSDRNKRNVPSGTIIGRATEASTLIQAGIESAVGIIAGTENDADNLSILMTANEINSNMFRVARQNEDHNHPVFRAADVDLLMQRGRVVSNKIFALIRTPLLGDFLRIMERFNNEWASMLVSRVIGVIDQDMLELWEVRIFPDKAPALCSMLENQQILVEDLLRDPINRRKTVSTVPLFLKRKEGNVMLPKEGRALHQGDRILLCGSLEARQHMNTICHSINALGYVLTGKYIPDGYIWRWLQARKKTKAHNAEETSSKDQTGAESSSNDQRGRG